MKCSNSPDRLDRLVTQGGHRIQDVAKDQDDTCKEANTNGSPTDGLHYPEPLPCWVIGSGAQGLGPTTDVV